MKSPNLKIILGIGILLNFSIAMADAGGMEGGGGNSIVCRNPDGSIRSAEFLDLYEGRTVYQLSYQESPVEWLMQAKQKFEKAGITQENDFDVPPLNFLEWFRSIPQHLIFLPPGTSLRPIPDSLEVIIPRDCKLEQTVNYQNDQRILVDGEIWNALSNTQRSALIIHESIYRSLRIAGEKDSRRARNLTAHIMADQKIEKAHSFIPYPDQAFECGGGEPGTWTVFQVTRLYSNPHEPGAQVRLNFSYLGGRIMLSRTYIDMDISWENLLMRPDRNIGVGHLSLTSLFETGDIVNLNVGKINNLDLASPWVIRLWGTSIFDGSDIKPVEIRCGGGWMSRP